MMTGRRRVAVFGGGCAGLATAYELTRPELDGRFEVTVYQPGWRLGGKGASSRGACARIEEHGIHLWMGCYENAFRMIREVYAEVAPARPQAPIRSWRDAFLPVTHIGLGRWSAAAGWDVWSAFFPPMPGLPGDPLDRVDLSPADPFSVQGYVVRAVITLGLLVEHTYAAPPRLEYVMPLSETDQRAWTERDLFERAMRVVRGGFAAIRSPVQLMDAFRLLLGLVGGVTVETRRVAMDVLDVAIAALQELLGQSDVERDAMSVADVVEVVGVSVRGCLAEGVIGSDQGFDLVDDWDFRDWLRRHGASARCIDSPFVRGMYSLMFAYEGGDIARPALSAGVFLRVCARMFFTYRGALFWRMAAGMGEIVFAPLYECLRARGVRFEFFHRLERVGLGDGQGLDGASTSRVEELEVTVQAATRDGAPYQPLVDVGGLPCWPAEPLWDQLEQSGPRTGPAPDYEAAWCREHVARRTLHVGDDFDYVVIASGLGAIPRACAELIERHPRWRAMVECVQTVATQAVQLWLEPTLSELGWRRGPIMMTGFSQPFDSWGDMSNLVPWESWPPGEEPGSLSYFCNVLPDAGSSHAWDTAEHAEHMRGVVLENVRTLLEVELREVWPAARTRTGGFDWSQLSCPPGLDGSPLEAQYVRANTNPSDRYVLSVPGTSAARISPLDRDCDNLTVAGDWTSCGVNVGCIEAAVMSGMLAAHALTGELPRTDDIIGYHHP